MIDRFFFIFHMNQVYLLVLNNAKMLYISEKSSIFADNYEK